MRTIDGWQTKMNGRTKLGIKLLKEVIISGKIILRSKQIFIKRFLVFVNRFLNMANKF